MSLLDRLKEEAKKQREKKEGGTEFVKVNWYKPEKGDNLVRFLPSIKEKDWKKEYEHDFWKEVRTHFGVPDAGGKYTGPARCLRDFNKNCPLCDAHDYLVEKDKEAAREFRVTKRFLMNVIDYKNKKVCVYPCPQTIFSEILEWIEETGTNVTHAQEGRNFKLIKEVEAGKPVQFGTSYKLRPDLNASAIPTKMIGMLDEMTNLDEVYKDDREEDMKAMLKKINFSTPVAEESEEEEFEDEVDSDLEDELRALGIE